MTEDQRDAHLRQALRHAPDAQMEPPADLSALILKEARAKAREAQTARPPTQAALTMLWRRLTHPALATGLAGVMVATLVGLMWWDQPMDEARFRTPVPTATPASGATAAPARTSPPSNERADSTTPLHTPEISANRVEDDAARTRKAMAERSGESEKRAKKSEAPSPSAQEEAPAPHAQIEEKPAASLPAPAPAPAAANITPSSPAPASLPTPGADASGAAPVASAMASPPVAPASEHPRSRTIAPAGASLADRLDTRRQATELRSRLVNVRNAIAADPSRWTWQRGSGAERDMNDALQAWLAQLDNAAGSGWRPRAALEGTPPLGRELRLLRDGRALHSLRITERGVLWENEQASWEAELPAGTPAALQTTLDTATAH